MVGPTQRRILDMLAAGPCSLNALVHAIDPSHPTAVNHAVKRLMAAGLVEENGRRSTRRRDGAMVALVEAVVPTEAPRRAVGAELPALAERRK
jgi:DNA-binding transcriptional ArsR family regulator